MPQVTVQPVDELIGTADAEQILGINRSQILRLVHTGVLPIAQKLPGKLGVHLFHRHQVVEAAVARRAALIAKADRIQVPAP